MRFVFRKSRAPSAVVLGLLAASFVVLGIGFRPVQALTPVVSNDMSTDGGAGISSVTVTGTVANVGDTIVVFAEAESLDATLYTITGVTAAAVSGGFTELNSLTAYCIGAVGFCSGAGVNRPNFISAWVGVATAAGVGKNFVATASGTVSNDLGAQAYDISNAGSTPALTVTGFCNAVKNQDCGNPAVTSQSVSPQLASVYVAGAFAIGSTFASAGSQMTYVGGANPTAGVFAQNTLVPPTNFPVNFNGNSGLNTGFGMIGLVFNNPAVTVTTTVNTNCLGAGCSGGNNGTSTYFSTAVPPLFVFYASQNIASAGQIDNFTMKVKAVHITTTTGTLRIGIYEPATPTSAPGGGNLYTLLKEDDVTVTNGTSNFFIHANPQANICSTCFYAVGIMGATTASRGSGATGSGVSFYESSQTGVTQYQFNPGGTTLPASFFSSSILTPNFFMFIHETYVVAISSTTITSTLSGAVTTTISLTVTSTTLDMNLAVQNGADYGMLLMVILLPAFALAVPVWAYTKSPQAGGIAFVAGLMLGSGLGVQAALVPPVFLGITVIIGIFMIVGLSRSGGGA